MPSRVSVLRERSDLVALAHVGLTALVFSATYAHSCLWLPLAVFLAVHLVAVEHNHGHVAIFRNRVCNGVLDLVLLFLCGIPMACWRKQHARSHHRAPWTGDDHSSPFAFRRAVAPFRPVGYRYYQVVYLPLFVMDTVSGILRDRRPRELRELGFTLAVFVAAHLTVATVFGVWPWAALHACAYAASGMALGSVNYLQHWRTQVGDDRHGARTFVCRIHNALNYNAGYHDLHHRRPSLHWSRLAATHATDPTYTPVRFVERDLFPAYRGPAALRAWFAAVAAKREGRAG
ncbi:MAG: fatty acid desaturase [Planctomycetota bacterium]